MIREYGVIKILKRNDDYGDFEAFFFTGVGTDINGHVEIQMTKDPTKAMHITPISFDTIGGSRIKNLIDFINKATFKDTHAEFTTFKIEV